MRVWRLVPASRERSAFDGEGARLFGGRWNPRGTAMVYLSSTLSLAALEILAHADFDTLPDPYVALPVDIPDRDGLVEVVDAPQVSRRWLEHPAPPELAAFGAAWVKASRSLLARVPSALIPQEFNYLLNPNHPDAKLLRIGAPAPFHFDARLQRH